MYVYYVCMYYMLCMCVCVCVCMGVCIHYVCMYVCMYVSNKCPDSTQQHNYVSNINITKMCILITEYVCALRKVIAINSDYFPKTHEL